MTQVSADPSGNNIQSSLPSQEVNSTFNELRQISTGSIEKQDDSNPRTNGFSKILDSHYAVYCETSNEMQKQYEENRKQQSRPYLEFSNTKAGQNLKKLRGILRVLIVMRAFMVSKRLLGTSSSLEFFRRKELTPLKFDKICDFIVGKRDYCMENLSPRKVYLLYQDSVAFLVWDTVVLVLFFYICCFYPFKIAFLQNEDLLAVDWAFDSLTVVDVVVKFFTAVTDKANTVDDLRVIAKSYLKTFFVLDALSLIPVASIVRFSDSHVGVVSRQCFRCVKLLRVFRVISRLPSNVVVQRVRAFMNFNKRLSDLLSFVLFSVLFLHFLSCWIFFVTTLSTNGVNLINHADLQDSLSTPAALYTVSLYYIVTTICTVGIGDISPQTTFERACVCLLIFVGMCFYSYTLGTLGNFLSESNESLSNVSHRFAFLNSFATERQINPSLLDKITVNLEYFEGIEGVKDCENSNDLLSGIALDLTYEITRHIHQDLIRKISVFQHKDINFVSQIIPFFKPRKFQEKETIYNFGENPTFVYFLIEGRVEFHNNYCKIFKEYVEGSYFGEIEILKGFTRQNSTRAKTEVETLMLPADVFVQHIENFPEIKNEFLHTAIRRDMINKKSEIRAEKLHRMKFSRKQDSGNKNVFDMVVAESKSNLTEFKQKIMALCAHVSVESWEKLNMMQGVGKETQDRGHQERLIMDLQRKSILVSCKNNPFLVSHKRDFMFPLNFQTLNQQNHKNNETLVMLFELFLNNQRCIRKTKAVGEEGVQTTGADCSRWLVKDKAMEGPKRRPDKGTGSLLIAHTGKRFGVGDDGEGFGNRKGSRSKRINGHDQSCSDDSDGSSQMNQRASFTFDNQHMPTSNRLPIELDLYSKGHVKIERIILKRRDVLSTHQRADSEDQSSQSSVEEL